MRMRLPYEIPTSTKIYSKYTFIAHTAYSTIIPTLKLLFFKDNIGPVK